MTIAYSHIPRFHVGVDCIIFTVDSGGLKVLLVRRDFDPGKGDWSLIGGFVGEDESVDAAAGRVLFELTGIRTSSIFQLGAFGAIGRDPGARVISVAYFALLNPRDIDYSLIDSHNAVWVSVDSLPPLGFDHKEMIESALKEVRRKTVSGALAFTILPELFTLTQLQTLVENVIGRQLDKRNFRKRVTFGHEIEKTDLIDKQSSRRGASLYRYAGDLL